MDQIETAPQGYPRGAVFSNHQSPMRLIFPTPPRSAITRTGLDKLVTPPILEVSHESRVHVKLIHLTSLARPGSTTAPGLFD